MTQNQTINVALQSVGVLFCGSAATMFSTNFWGAIVCGVVGVAIFVVYELLP